MTVKERLLREIDQLPEDALEEVFDFVAFLRKKLSEAEALSWSDFALGTGAFDFWNDPEEVEYSLSDLNRKP
jgi:hypothetical protein